jgi:hypothetical protein
MGFAWGQKGRKGGQDGKQVTCQRCLQSGHYTYECTNDKAYIAKSSHSKQLKRGRKQKFLDPSEVPDEFRSKSELEILEKERAKNVGTIEAKPVTEGKKEKKRKLGSKTSSESSATSSSSYTSSGYTSSGYTSSSYTSSSSPSSYSSG